MHGRERKERVKELKRIYAFKILCLTKFETTNQWINEGKEKQLRVQHHVAVVVVYEVGHGEMIRFPTSYISLIWIGVNDYTHSFPGHGLPS